MVAIPEDMLPEGFSNHMGMPMCPCGNITEVDGEFPCEHENPVKKLLAGAI
jgi:hypothetical protein